jgi:ribosomal protein S12 methylthiotransferase accessory factor YcaO
MIEPSTRVERLEAEGNDPEVACLLLDCVIGFGSHPDPAGAMASAIVEAREKAARRGGYLPVIASVTGTPGDYQGMAAQKAALEAAGATVMPSNYAASMLALEIMRKVIG